MMKVVQPSAEPIGRSLQEKPRRLQKTPASTFRGNRGGANGAPLRLRPAEGPGSELWHRAVQLLLFWHSGERFHLPAAGNRLSRSA